jgi:hypothetical protein
LLAQLLDEGPDYNCDEGRHEPHAIRVATAAEPLGFYCTRCRVTCDATGAELRGVHEGNEEET